MRLFSHRNIPQQEANKAMVALYSIAKNFNLGKAPVDCVENISLSFNTIKNTINVMVTLPPNNKAQGGFLKHMKSFGALDFKITQQNLDSKFTKGDSPEILTLQPSCMEYTPIVTTEDIKSQRITLSCKYTDTLAKKLGVNSTSQGQSR
jgi:hypothetical protein